MDVTDISKHLDKLDGNVDGLEAALKPILSNLNETASTLPLLDRAKLYITVAYAIESTLHSALRLGGVDIRTHSITKELARLKQYFEKIKQAEAPPVERTQTVDKQAAIRFIKADLADNSEINAKLKEKLAIEREKAAATAAARGKKRPAEDTADSTPTGTDKMASTTGGSSAEEGQVDEPASKKPRKARNRKGRGGKSNKNRNQ